MIRNLIICTTNKLTFFFSNIYLHHVTCICSLIQAQSSYSHTDSNRKYVSLSCVWESLTNSKNFLNKVKQDIYTVLKNDNMILCYKKLQVVLCTVMQTVRMAL